MNSSNTYKNDVSIVICGAAGLGIETIEHLLAQIIQQSGYHICATKEYMSRVRGGLNSTEIRVSSNRVRAYIDRIDLFFPFSKGAIERQAYRFTKDTIIIGDTDILKEANKEIEASFIDFSLKKAAKKIGGEVYTNTIVATVIGELLKIDTNLIRNYIKERFSKKGEEVIEKNLEAIEKGCEFAKEIIDNFTIKIKIKPDSTVSQEVLYNGTDMVSIGALAGGCNFLAAYPMSPATGVLTFLAQQQKEFDVIVEQIEDEIAAVNSVIGAWYVGGRGLLSTSGGGFSLMTEGISLAGVTETPLVIHLAQRPGPATGLPTRTAQEDLSLALHAGHGEFPRIILSPGNLEETFILTQKTFNLADKYQIPVFVLTDQYLVNLFYNFEAPDFSKLKIDKHIIETKEDYKRYEITDSGISPRGIPGGKGLVGVDSHEHDDEGHITEDLRDCRKEMVEKRFRKEQEIENDIIPAKLEFAKNYEILVISWGSTYEIIKEAISQISNKKIGFLHFSQIYPLPKKTKKLLKKAKELIIFETNFRNQFAELIKAKTGIEIPYKFSKYIGLSFSVEEIKQSIKSILKEVQK
ncbi:MAG: 2-oxoacid:acceptor oxidoreductase subunit alpha [Asgard group archaeon]|nr:2-oxoacid:acceptor oxidoreductase subunit alpha [Asgard group archaeon]